MLYLKRLKTILQSNTFYIIFTLLLLIFVIITTKVIKYNSNINKNSFTGVVTNIVVNDDKVDIYIKNKEIFKGTIYNKDNIDYYDYLGKKVKVIFEDKEISNNTIFNTFNYKEYLYNNGIYKIGNINNITIIKDSNIFYKIKLFIIKRINTYDNKIKEYLNLFILGNKSMLDNNIYSSYKDNGISHLFAISGMHINLIIVLLSFIFKKFRYKNIVISITLLFFMFITNFTASVLRTCIFFVLKFLSIFLNIKINNIKLLFLTLYIVLIINPFMIYNTGLLYSFIITLSLLLEKNHILGNYIVRILKISFISFIVSLPITMSINYEINLLSIILNIIYVPFVSLIVFPLSILTFIFPFLSNILIIIINILEKSSLFFNINSISIVIPKLNIFIIIIYYGLLLLFYFKRKKILIIMCLTTIILYKIIFNIDSNNYVYYFDVSQGDSFLIITPYHKNITMIDTGGIVNSDYHPINNIILFLKSIGITKINSLIITHGDYDHMGETVNLVNNFKVEKVIFNCGEYNELEEDLIKVLNKKKIPYYSCIKEFNLDNNKLYFLQTKELEKENKKLK